VRKVIDKGTNGKLTLHMILSVKTLRRKEVAVHSPQAQAKDIDE